MISMTNSTERQIQLEKILAKYDPRTMTDEDFDTMRKEIEELKTILENLESGGSQQKPNVEH